MLPTLIPTWYAPAERASRSDVLQLAQRFLGISPYVRAILDAVPDIFMALNPERQIVFANRSLLNFACCQEADLLGLRPGEALGCAHALDRPAGCGTTEFCVTCGAAQAILNSACGLPDVQECRITRCEKGEALDFRVWSTPLAIDGDRFTLLTLSDISEEKRRRALERIFFHDVLNTVTAMKAASDLLARRGNGDTGDLSQIMRTLVDRLIDEIAAQRQLTDAENDELAVNRVTINVPALLADLARAFTHHQLAEGRPIRVAPAGDMALVSDPVILRRVLVNMLKNALEASRPGETVTLGYRLSGDEIEFWVHNPGVMPRPVQLQVFQRSFSTKGTGRGLGAYSMKLLGERYLGGRVGFTSSPEAGTTFTVRLPARPPGHQ